jgi:tetratricopeptide (TPR) repeat protein
MKNTYKANEFDVKFYDAHQVVSSGKLEKAWNILLDLSGTNKQQNLALFNLKLDISLKRNKPIDAVEPLKLLLSLSPRDVRYVNLLSELYSRTNNSSEAVKCWRKYITFCPTNGSALFNLAYYLRLNGNSQEAISTYRKSIKVGVEGIPEIHCNMATIYTDDLLDHETALIELQLALNIDPKYVPAIFNKGNLFERTGRFLEAIDCFLTVQKLVPSNLDALARVLDLKTFQSVSDPTLQKAIKCSQNTKIEEHSKINLLFSIGVALDKLGEYDIAFSCVKRANNIDKVSRAPYENVKMEAYISEIKKVFNANFIEKNKLNNTYEPVFICGMFRSGSTLTEQILGAHPAIFAAGELSFFPQLITNTLNPFPSTITNLTSTSIDTIAKEYCSVLSDLKSSKKIITDKRPDNFEVIGLIKLLFPKAKIIWTRRDFLDNCLSVYFLRLGQSMGYSSSLSDIAHFYKQQERLMQYWTNLFPDCIHEVDYDALVHDPRAEISPVLQWLNLNWKDECLDYHLRDSLVQTASSIQIREPIYIKSSGRWKNYQPYINDLLDLF